MKICCLLALTSLSMASPVPPEEAADTWQVADDLIIELVAAEPLVGSPCALAFDARGRLFVAENRGYPRFDKPAEGIVAMLTDADGDGKMDQRKVFADGLTFPNGVLPWKDGLIVSCAPDILFLRDSNGDGEADEKRVLLTGFDTTQSTQLRVNAPQIGPDGWIYLAAGLSGGSITCPEHPERPALKMTSDVRFHPETLVVELVDGKSQFGQSFDSAGRRFICMNRLPVQHVVLSSKWLGRNPNLAFSDTVQDCSERPVKTGLKGGGDGVRLFPISSNITTADSHQGSFSAACGVTVWRGGALPERYDGCVLSCDPTGNLVHCDKLESSGASFHAVPLLQGKEMLASRDDWCRPVFLTRGPEGALYVADMYRKVIEHPDYLPEEVRKKTDFETGRAQGRIWRVTAKTPRLSPPLAAFQDEFASVRPAATDAALAQQLAGDPNPRVRFILALVLGDSKSEFSTEIMAKIAIQDAADKWTRAAVLSGIGGRETKFLQALWPQLTTANDAMLPLLTSLGRCFDTVPALTDALAELAAKPSILQAALWIGLQERLTTLLTRPVVYPELLTMAAELLTKENSSAPVRLICARLLATGAWASAAPALQQAWKQPGDSALQSAVLRSLIQLDGKAGLKFLLEDNAWTRYEPMLRELILNECFARSQLEGLLHALEAQQIPASAIIATRRETFLHSKDPALKQRAEKLFQAVVSDRTAAMERGKQALLLTAKPAHGKEVFKQLCATCHRLEREGINLGPDLFDIRRQSKDNILFHIVMPEAEVAPAFTPYVCEIKSGRTTAGILTSETGTTITLRQPAGLEETILRSEIKALNALPGSLMPAGLDAAMQPQDLADLVAFLKGE
jgi:putative membrane-bound dehydrogenase-like protein